jgi:hypothetical protein
MSRTIRKRERPPRQRKASKRAKLQSQLMREPLLTDTVRISVKHDALRQAFRQRDDDERPRLPPARLWKGFPHDETKWCELRRFLLSAT